MHGQIAKAQMGSCKDDAPLQSKVLDRNRTKLVRRVDAHVVQGSRSLRAAAPGGHKGALVEGTYVSDWHRVSRAKKVSMEVEGLRDWEIRLVLVKVPEVIEAMIKGGISLPTVILGGMGFKDGRTRINKNISASSEEVECMKRIVAMGTKIVYQLVPSTAQINFENALEGRE